MVKEELIKLTEDLIRFKSTKGNPGEIKKCIDYVKNYFSGDDFIVKEFESNGKPSLMITYTDTKKPKLLLNGHLDVVEADEEQFTPTIEGDKLLGRGSSDMKGGLACLMLLMKNFAKTKPNMGLMVVSDEEIGGKNGTSYLVKQGFGGDFMIAAEPNKSDSPDIIDVTIKHKGISWLKITTKGKAIHASLPWLGENAADKLIKKYLEIKKMFKTATINNTWKTTMSLGKINSGDAPNQVPEKAEMIIDIRYIETTDIDELIKKIKSVGDINVEIIEKDPMLVNDENDPMIKKFQKYAEKVSKNKTRLIKFHGSTDARFTSAKGITSIVCGPHGQNLHGKGEYISIKGMELYYKVMEEFVRSL